MMEQTLKIEGIPMNLNTYRNAHYHLLNKEKLIWEKAVALAIREQGIRPLSRCKVTMEFFFKDKRRHDPDNYSCCAKFILDGMVKAGILSDDNFEVIEMLSVMQGGISKKPYINIVIQEVK